MSTFNNGNQKSDRPAARAVRAKKINPKNAQAVKELVEDHGWKPISEWDLEELAKGKPKDKNGKFAGRRPDWVTAEVMAEIRKRHKQMITDGVHEMAKDAMALMHTLMHDDDVDENGKPITPASVKFSAAKYILDQTVGAPTAKIEAEINHKLSGLIQAVVVNPDGTPSYPVLDNVLEAEIVEEDEDDEL